QIQYGGRILCRDGVFPKEGGRAVFRIPALPLEEVPEGAFRLSTRRGKQFNTMVHASVDPLTGAPRDAVLLSGEDASRLGLGGGDAVELTSAHGRFLGHVHLGPMKPGNVQVHYPEGSVLLAGGVRDPASGIPDYNVWVWIRKGNGGGG